MSEALNLFNNSKKEIAEIRYELPGSGQEIFLRPFTTKEQKVILKALEKEDHYLVGEAMDDLLRRCVTNPNNFNPDTLLSKDRECLLIKLRQESVKEDFDHSWKCSECGKENVLRTNLSTLPFESVAFPDNLKETEIELKKRDLTMILGLPTREDEKNILRHAKKHSLVKKEVSQTELLMAAYASVIKGIKTTKDVKNEQGEVVDSKDVIIPVPFNDRLKIIDDMEFEDKNLIKKYFEGVENYGYNLKLGMQTCKHCGEESEQEMEWIYFFIM